MPPQSRGLDGGSHPLSRTSAPSQIPRTYDDSHTKELVSANETARKAPRASANDEDEDDSRTPVRPQFEIGGEDEDEQNEHDEEKDQDSLDDGEFESHYSRQESTASSDESDENDSEADFGIGENDNGSENDDVVEMNASSTIQRVNSLPVGSQLTHHHNPALHKTRSSVSLTRAAPPPVPPPLYPPFYNRPPTPLPPSPSLTSLLRPPSLLNRSTTSTRPTTPDSSDAETPNDTEAAVAHSARRASPLPPTSPKVPTYEYYGFVLYLASSLTFLMYVLWSYLPSPFLHALGITYYPNRWWSLAIPAWIVMVLVYTYIALACWNVEYMTLGLQTLDCMVDEAGSVAILDEHGRLIKGGSKRYEVQLSEQRRLEKTVHIGTGGNGSTSRRKGGGGGGSSRRKDKKKKEKERDREEKGERYGYMGEVLENGRVANGMTWGQTWNEGTDAVMDIPIGGVCEVLYGGGAEST